MPEPCKLLSFDSCRKRFLWTHKEVDLAPLSVVGLELQAGDTEKFPRALGFKSLNSFFRIGKQGPCFTAEEVGGGDKRLVELLNLLAKLMALHCQILFSLAILRQP